MMNTQEPCLISRTQELPLPITGNGRQTFYSIWKLKTHSYDFAAASCVACVAIQEVEPHLCGGVFSAVSSALLH